MVDKRNNFMLIADESYQTIPRSLSQCNVPHVFENGGQAKQIVSMTCLVETATYFSICLFPML